MDDKKQITITLEEFDAKVLETVSNRSLGILLNDEGIKFALVFFLAKLSVALFDEDEA